MSKKWDPHKEEILRLYIVENLTLDHVIDHMTQTYGFDQKKSHYEYRLKLWGARKYMKRGVLEYISHQDRNRGPLHGLDYGIYVADGILLSESRVNRARRKYNLDLSLARKFGRAPSPKLPPGHIVQRTSPPAPAIAIDWPKSLPWLRFEDRFKIVMPQSSRFIMILAQAAKNCSLISGMTIDDSSHLARAIYATSQETQVNAVSLARMLPYIPTNSQSAMLDTGLSNPNDAATNVLKAFLFRVSNKLYGYEREQWRKNLLLLFHELDKTSSTVLSYLINSKDPTSEAIIESLYEAAIEHGATALATRLLEAGMDANALLSISWRIGHHVRRGRARFQFSEHINPSTALQYAARTCNIQSASALIKAGAKADLGQPTPLQILCARSKVGHPDTLYFADLLISHGAQVNSSSNRWPSPLEGAVLCKNRSLVWFLLQQGATDVLHEKRSGLLHEFLQTEEHILEISGKNHTLLPSSALHLAIITRDDSIAKALVSSITIQEVRGNELLGRAFITACVAGDQDFVRVILEHFDYQLVENKELIESAFVGAAWDLDCRIAKLLVKHHVVRRKLQNACLPIFQAAALHGNVNLIMVLHSSRFDINSGRSLEFRLRNVIECIDDPLPPISSTPLGCAVWMNHKDVIEAFLDLGADTSGIDLKAAIQSRSFELITKVLSQYSNVDMSHDEEYPLDIAIRYDIGLELICQLINAGAVLKGHEIVDAVRSNDLEVVKFLLPACDILAINPSGETVLEVACYVGNLDIAFRYFACGGAYGSRALFLAVGRAVKMHDYRFIELVVAKRPPGPIDEYEASALALSIRMNDTALMDILLHDDFRSSNALSIYKYGMTFDHGIKAAVKSGIFPLEFEDLSHAIERVVPEPDYGDFFSPLLVAACCAPERIVRRMLDHGYLLDPYLHGMIHIHESSFVDKEIRDMIMSAYVLRQPNVADRDWHRRMLLVTLGNGLDFGIIQQHFAKLPSLDYRQGGACPLEFAVQSGSYDHVRAVLKAGATADARKWPFAKPAFEKAVKCGSLEIVSLLLEYGADINYDPHQYLNSALNKGDLRMAVFLLDHGLDINTPLGRHRSGSYHTCLEHAAENGMIDAVELLFSRGANIQGRARIHFIRSVVLATNGCHYATAKLLKDRGCWNDGDDALAKTPRGRSTYHMCPRFVYDDLTLKGCHQCDCKADMSSTSDSSEEDEDMTDSPHSYEGADEQFTLDEMDPLTNDMSVLDIELGTMDCEPTTEMHEWPFVSDGRQDMELDTIVKGLLLEDGTIS